MTNEDIAKRITNELDECLATINGEVYRWEDKIIEVDQVNKTITIKFDYTDVPEDDYVGLGKY